MNRTKLPVVLIHGYAFDYRLWDPVSLALDGRESIRLSLPGFVTPAPKTAYTIESLASEFWGYLDSRGVGDIILIGHSMGGYTAIEMVSQQMSRVKGLGLIHSHVFADTPEKKEKRLKTLEEIEKSGQAAFVDGLMRSLFADEIANSEILNALLVRASNYEKAAWYFGTKAMAERKDHGHTLASYENPVLFVLGDKDKSVPLELGYKQASLPSKSELLVCKNVGHLSIYEDTSAVLNGMIRFLDSL